MRTRPKYLMVLSAIFFLLALSMPGQVMWLYGHPLAELGRALDKLTWLNWSVLGLLLACAYWTYSVSPALRFAIPALIGLTVFNNLVAGLYATDFSLWQTSLGSAAFALLNLPFLRPEVLQLLRHPQRRWWVRAERKRVHLPVFIEGMRLNTLKAETFDISESGMFVAHMHEAGVGDWITLRIGVGPLNAIRFQGRVARRAEARGSYPAGVGIQFMDLSGHQRRELRRHLSRPPEI